jgi:hypothetical protein
LLVPGAAAAGGADGDPASDVLPTYPLFLGSAVDTKSKAAAQLDALVKEAKQRGFPINVVLISRLADLGSANYLWNDPNNYADFITGEIACCVHGRILIVMPGGFGVTYVGHSAVSDRKVVAKLPAPGKIKNLLPASIEAVRRLAAASGVQLAVPDVEPVPGGVFQPFGHSAAPVPSAAEKSGTDWLFVLSIVVLVAAALALVAWLVLRRRPGRAA